MHPQSHPKVLESPAQGSNSYFQTCNRRTAEMPPTYTHSGTDTVVGPHQAKPGPMMLSTCRLPKYGQVSCQRWDREVLTQKRRHADGNHHITKT
mmetsp:Transcript_93264/g.161668  ORF Transcript_93264/g.161668 Transcript_93264/m.161668 type:complete len:94 (-) Transcript_93264:764-1045(-)